MGSFSIKKGWDKQVADKLMAVVNVVNNGLEQKMNLAVEIVYKTATARRPKIASTKANRGQYRVSDPNAILGVPVKTGALRASINKDVSWHKGKIQGTISTDMNYAAPIEFGTSKMQARP